MPQSPKFKTYEDVILPLMAVVEAIGTKGQSPGTAAMSQRSAIMQGRQTEQDRLDKEVLSSENKIRQAEQDEIARKERAFKKKLGGFQIRSAQAGLSEKLETQAQKSALEKRISGYNAEWEAAQTPEEKRAVNVKYIESPVAQKRLQYSTKTSKPEISQAEKVKNAVELATAKGNITKRLPANQTRDLGDSKTSIDQLDSMIEKAEKLDLWFMPTDKLRALNPWDKTAKQFDQLVASTKQVVGKGLEGGVLRAEDEKKYERIIPKLGDTKEVLQAKANQLREMLVRKHNSTIDAYGKSGFRVDKFPQIQNIKYTIADVKPEEEIEKPAVQISNDEDYNALPSGTEFIAPDGSTRTKP